MTMRVEISCVRTTEGAAVHQRITHVGGVDLDGRRWELEQDEAIAGAENESWDFFIRHDGAELKVTVATRGGKKYLSTDGDSERENRLCSLPVCQGAT